MQSIFRLPWCTDQIAPKMQTGKVALDNMRASPVMDIPMLSKLKRKRSVDASQDPCLPHLGKRQRAEGASMEQSPPAHFRLPAQPASGPAATSAPEETSVTISSQLPASGGEAIIAMGQALETKAMPSFSSSMGDNKQSMNMEVDAKAIAAESNDSRMSNVLKEATEDACGLTPLQQVIENEFNMQILMKHNELRLIEQELAKCQVALEQLRRCEIRPYPGAEQLSAAVSAGIGPAAAPAAGHTKPAHPAPHGVTDGPYTRHYRQWLLHDPAFDSVPLQAPAVDTGGYASARSTRHASGSKKTVQKSTIIQPRAHDSLHSLPNYPTSATKDKSAPLVLRRSTDGQLVKLICNNCERGNFSSIQGFLNHCRIAHKVDYKSHDSAAQDCGRLLNEHETANLPPEVQAAPVPRPSVSRPSSTSTTPFKTQHLVHPMNMPGGPSPLASSLQATAEVRKSARPVPHLASGASPAANSTPFKASSQAPRLSAQFAKYNLGGNLEQAIASAKQKVDLGMEDDFASPDGIDSASPLTPATGSRTIAGIQGAGSLAPSSAACRPSSRKGHAQSAQRHRPSPLSASRDAPVNAGEVPESPQDHFSNLSPHTADSNPGLVSDDEDESASEDEHAEIPHHYGTPPVRQRGCADADHMDIDIAVDDDLDQHGVLIRRNSMVARPEGSPSRKGA